MGFNSTSMAKLLPQYSIGLDSLVERLMSSHHAVLEVRNFLGIKLILGANNIRLTTVAIIANDPLSGELRLHGRKKSLTEHCYIVHLTGWCWTINPCKVWMIDGNSNLIVKTWLPTKLVA